MASCPNPLSAMFSGASVYVSFSLLPQPQMPEAQPSPLSKLHLVAPSGVDAGPSNSSLQTCTQEPVTAVVSLVAVTGAVCEQPSVAPSAMANVAARELLRSEMVL